MWPTNAFLTKEVAAQVQRNAETKVWYRSSAQKNDIYETIETSASYKESWEFLMGVGLCSSLI